MPTPTYRGLSFPFRASSLGFPAPSEDDELLWESIVSLLQTGLGERVMRPDVGSLAYSFLFENNDILLGQLIASDIAQLLARYEPRILLQSVQVTSVDRDRGEIVLDIAYLNRLTMTPRSRSVTLSGTG